MQYGWRKTEVDRRTKKKVLRVDRVRTSVCVYTYLYLVYILRLFCQYLIFTSYILFYIYNTSLYFYPI